MKRIRIFFLQISCAAMGQLLYACGPAQSFIDVRETPSKGNTDAPYEVVVYSDFQCPYCRAAAISFKDLLRDHPEKLHLYFKHFPLKQHPQSVKAAAAAEAARLQGKFWEMHDLIFDNATSLTDDIYETFARNLGLNVAKFKADAASKTVAAKLAADRAEAELSGLNGTPFLVVNGAPYNGSFYDLIREIESRP